MCLVASLGINYLLGVHCIGVVGSNLIRREGHVQERTSNSALMLLLMLLVVATTTAAIFLVDKLVNATGVVAAATATRVCSLVNVR